MTEKKTFTELMLQRAIRDKEICRRYLAGETQEQLGNVFNLSHQRISVILREGDVKVSKPAGTATYLGVSIDREVKRRVKERAQHEGKSISRIVNDALKTI